MNCPECNTVIDVPDLLDGDRLVCEECGQELEIVALAGGGIVLEPLAEDFLDEDFDSMGPIEDIEW